MAGRQLGQPLCVFQSMKRYTAPVVSSLLARIASRTAWGPWLVQPHMGLVFGVAGESPPAVEIRNGVNRPLSLMALQIWPLVTPLQPHTSSLSCMAAALLWPWWPASPMFDSPNISLSRMSATGRASRSSLKYQLPSTVSPYRQAPTSLSSLSTSFLYTPPKGSLMTISSVPSPPWKSPALNRSIPVTLSLVEVSDPW